MRQIPSCFSRPNVDLSDVFLDQHQRSECKITSMPNQASVIASECKRMNKKDNEDIGRVLMMP